MTALFTIGYEGRELAELLAMVAAARVDRVIDVRALPLSRRRGFSKTPLGTALTDAGIEYLHLRSAGNPYRHEADALAQYRAHLRAPVVNEVAAAVQDHRAALLCFERDPVACHRTILATRIARKLGLTTQAL